MSTSDGIVREFWQHPWGRTLVVAATIAMVSWAVRETAVITFPIFEAMNSVIIPLALGFTLAYVLTPAVDKLQNRGMTRMMATSILFILLVLVSILTLSLVVPAIVSQTTDMVKRSVEEAYFYDKNGDGNFSPGEAVIRPFTEDGNQFYFHDANNNGRYDIGEGRYDQSHFATLSNPEGIVKEPSFIQKTTALINGYQADLESMVGVEPDEKSLAFVVYYLDRTKELREAIRDGLAINAETRAWNTWIKKVNLPKEIDPELTWKRNWPGAMWQELQDAREKLPQTHRNQWNVAMAYLGQQYAKEHQRMLNQWEKIRNGQGVNASAANGFLDALEADIDDQSRVESLKFINSLRNKGDVTSRELLIAISGPSSGDSQGVVQEMVLSMNAVLQQQIAKLPDYAAGWAGDLLANIGTVLMFSLNIFLIPVYAFFLCLGMPTIRATIKAYIPIKGHDRTLRIIQRIERAVAAFFRGRLIVCIICAILTWIGFAILGIPYAALFGLLIGLATAIPMAGLVFLVPAIILTLIEGGDGIALRAALAIVVYGIVQALEATVFTPTIMGKEVELHPVLLIVALLLCGSLLGVFGLILAVPIAATVRIFAREFFLPRIREAAGVPDTMMIKRAEVEGDKSILTRDVMNPDYQVSNKKEKKSETDVDGDDLADFEGDQ